MEKTFVAIKNCDAIMQLDANSILYVQVDLECASFYLADGSRYSCSKSLKNLISILPDFFVKINRNCLVNSHKIVEFKLKTRHVLLAGGYCLPVSTRNITAVKSRLFQNIQRLS